ncbi:hypothetical protein NR798_11450 [Archangium gephyra]|uniref:hypothetical protein n=1 Tax=Archangium gephyra TaxID=48 RepID=UPI0035D4AA47
MNSGTKLLRAVALMTTGLALTACGGAMTEEEAAALEAESMNTSAAELGSCAGWSEWSATGGSYCGSHSTCGYTWSCDYLRNGGTTAMDVNQQIYYCDDGSPAYKVYNPATFSEQSSYRVCFDQYGNYTHTEYQYQYAKSACGC